LPVHSLLVRNWIFELRSNKNKIQNRLNAAPDLGIQLSNIKPNIEIINKKGKKKRKKKHFAFKIANMRHISF
jgi:hypothetical protein